MTDYRIDADRVKRTGVPEIVFGETKSLDHLVAILGDMIRRKLPAIASRISPEKAERLKDFFPRSEYFRSARIFVAQKSKNPRNKKNHVAIVAAGTSDVTVAEEAKVLLNLLGCGAESFYDVGVAGIQRLFQVLPKIRKSKVVIVVAGMEGALPSVLAGLVKAPVIAVPTSIGYGTGLGGLSALLTMLNTCAPGVVVVNIDNGIGAAVAAYKMLNP